VSLRSRLLIAIGIIALVALAIADVATYKSLESFLYQRIDQQLDASHGRSENQLNNGGILHCASDPNFLAPGGAGAGGPTSTGTGTTGSTTSSSLIPAG